MVFTFSFVPLQVSRVLYIELLLFLQLWKMQFFFFFKRKASEVSWDDGGVG